MHWVRSTFQPLAGLFKMFSLLPREQTLLVTLLTLAIAYAAIQHWRDRGREIPMPAAPAVHPSLP